MARLFVQHWVIYNNENLWNSKKWQRRLGINFNQIGTKYAIKNYPNTLNISQSDKMSPNLVTLKGNGSSNPRGRRCG